MNKIRAIAIYLPQFHPITENDEWWGKGFTEWTNVAKAKSLFKNHYQPHLPADLGFYDLRLHESRLAQEALAKNYGIHGFCYYHYWFNGRKVLEKPLEEKLRNSKEDLPFMICWANENWTRTWDGSENQILLQQNYSEEDHRNHIRYLVKYFKDSRYIKIDGKAVFAVYRTALIPKFEEAAKIWRSEARLYDVELYIIRFESVGDQGKEFLNDEIDAATEFQPHTAQFNEKKLNNAKKGIGDELSFSSIKNSIGARLENFRILIEKKKNGRIFDYRKIVEKDISLENKKHKNYKLYSCVCPGWDNSSRKNRNYTILKNSTPEIFQQWMMFKLKHFIPFSKEENLFFINAWNEWAEGNHLEPDQKWGTKYLEAVKDCMKDYS